MLIHIEAAVREAGSPTKLALMLGLDRRRGGQRVSQWLRRSAIPDDAQAEHLAVWRRLSARIYRRARRKAAVFSVEQV